MFGNLRIVGLRAEQRPVEILWFLFSFLSKKCTFVCVTTNMTTTCTCIFIFHMCVYNVLIMYILYAAYNVLFLCNFMMSYHKHASTCYMQSYIIVMSCVHVCLSDV